MIAYLQLLADRLAGVVTGKTKRLIVNLPPRHFKTWIGSVCLSAWILGRRSLGEDPDRDLRPGACG